MSTTPIQEEMLDQYLTFSIGSEEYGIQIRYVKDIIPIPEQAITPVPWLADYIRGIINQRGTILPVIDVRMRFGRAYEPYHERTCVIVVELEEISIGMIVDAVKEVLTIPANTLVAPPQMGSTGENQYVSSIASLGGDNGVVLMLDIQRLFYDGDIMPDVAI